MFEDRVPAHFYVGLTNEGVQQLEMAHSPDEETVWPPVSSNDQPGQWLPRVTRGPNRLSGFVGVGYVVHSGSEVVGLLDSADPWEPETLWEVEPDWTSLYRNGHWRTRSARLLRRLGTSVGSLKRRLCTDEACRALGYAQESTAWPSDRRLQLAATVLNPDASEEDRAAAAASLGRSLADMKKRLTSAEAVPAASALVYATGMAAVAANHPRSVRDVLYWVGCAEHFAASDQPVEAASLLTAEPRERDRKGTQRLADVLGLEITADRPANAKIVAPAVERLPEDRVPTVPELTAAAERYAVAHATHRAGDICLATYDWLLDADQERHGLPIDAIVAGLSAEGVSAQGQHLAAIVRTVLDEATAEGLFEQLGESNWRITPGVPGVEMGHNPACLVKGAAEEGWDIVIPGCGYDALPVYWALPPVFGHGVGLCRWQERSGEGGFVGDRGLVPAP